MCWECSISRPSHPSILTSVLKPALHTDGICLVWRGSPGPLRYLCPTPLFKMGPKHLDYDFRWLVWVSFLSSLLRWRRKQIDFLGASDTKMPVEWEQCFQGITCLWCFAIYSMLLWWWSHDILLSGFDDRDDCCILWFECWFQYLLCVFYACRFFSMDECQKDDMQCPPGAGGVVAIINMFVLPHCQLPP
jgi:hypothetical protein